MTPATYAKAISGGIVAGLTALVLVIPNGVTAAEAIGVVLAIFASFGVIFAVPNAKPAEAPPQP